VILSPSAAWTKEMLIWQNKSLSRRSKTRGLNVDEHIQIPRRPAEAPGSLAVEPQPRPVVHTGWIFTDTRLLT